MPTLRDLILEGLTGSTQQELQDSAALGEAPIRVGPAGEDLDKAVHALASSAISRRYSPLLAQAIGGAKELGQGALSVATGGPFFGESAYDPEDIEANFVGIRREEEANRAADDPAGYLAEQLIKRRPPAPPE